MDDKKNMHEFLFYNCVVFYLANLLLIPSSLPPIFPEILLHLYFKAVH